MNMLTEDQKRANARAEIDVAEKQLFEHVSGLKQSQGHDHGLTRSYYTEEHGIAICLTTRGGMGRWRFDYETLQISVDAWQANERKKVFARKKDGTFSWDAINEFIADAHKKIDEKRTNEKQAADQLAINKENLAKLELSQKLKYGIITRQYKGSPYEVRLSLSLEELNAINELFKQMEAAQ